MPRSHPPEFRRRAVALAREHAKPYRQIATELGISESCLRNWVAQGIHVAGRPEWIFVKIHTHGAPEREAASTDGITCIEPIGATKRRRLENRFRSLDYHAHAALA